MARDATSPWRHCFRALKRDARRLRGYQRSKFGYASITWFLDPAWLCVCLYRFSHVFWRKGHKKTARLVMQFNSLVTGADIQPASELGAGLLVPNPSGVNISCKAGDNLVVLALSGIGGSVRDRDVGAGIGLPVLGNDVVANQFAGIQGSIHLGDGVVVEPGAGVVVDVVPDARVVLAAEPSVIEQPACQTRNEHLPDACRHDQWQHTRAAYRMDVARYIEELRKYASPDTRRPRNLSAILSNSLLAIWVYRLSHWLFLNGHRRAARVASKLNFLFHKLTIPPQSCIGGGLFVPHLAGTTFFGRAGMNLTLYANSFCGPTEIEPTSALVDSPWLGNDVMVGGQAGVFGPVTVGNGVQIGPKAQLAQDVGPDMQVWSSMARGSVRPKDMTDPASRPRDAEAPFASQQLPAKGRWSETRRRLKQDRARLRSMTKYHYYPSFACVLLFRLSHYFHTIGRLRLARWAWLTNVYLTGADISPVCEIGAGLVILHPANVAIHGRAGERLIVIAASGIGSAFDPECGVKKLDECPRLGHNTVLWPHTGIYGAVTVAPDVTVLSGCIITKSIGVSATVGPRPLKFRRRAAMRTPMAPTKVAPTNEAVR